jgi:hypothetical protein
MLAVVTATAVGLAGLPAGWLKPVVDVGEDGGPRQVIYALQPKQLAAFKLTPVYTGTNRYEHIGYGGAAGSAKSHTARAVAMAVAAQWPGSTSIIFRKTETEALENHYQKFRTELPEHVYCRGRKVRFYRWNGKELSFTFPTRNNSRILLGHLGHNDDVFKYIGNEYDCVIFEEATMQTEFQVEYITGNRMRATVNGSIPFALYPSNPGNVGHQWYRRRFITRDFREDEDGSKYVFLQARLADNKILELRDPGYRKRLDRLPEPYRSWQRDGDFEAGAGAALPQLRRAVHLVEPFAVPDYWEFFGAFDWGFDHPWTFGEYAANEDGDVYKLQSLTGRRDMPWEIAEKIKARVDVGRMRYIEAGRDVFQVRKARGEQQGLSASGDSTPTLHEYFLEAGIRTMRPANTARIFGLQNLRAYLAWENTGPEVNGVVQAGDPALRFFDNEGNRRCYAQLEAMVPNPDDTEDVLKVNANDFGEGGDDFYDETRYAICGRPRKATSVEQNKPIRAFDPVILQLEMDRGRKGDDKREKMPVKRNRAPMHPEQGEYT